MKEETWSSKILWYDLIPLELKVIKPHPLTTRLNNPRLYLVRKDKDTFSFSPITKWGKKPVERGEKENKIKFLHQFKLELDSNCSCLELTSFANLNTKIVVKREEITEFNERYLVDKRVINKQDTGEIHEHLSPSKLDEFHQKLGAYWDNKNNDLILIKVNRVYNFLLNLSMNVNVRTNKPKQLQPKEEKNKENNLS